MKLTMLEEVVIFERIIDLIDRGFLPRFKDVRDMADRLLGVCDVMCVRL